MDIITRAAVAAHNAIRAFNAQNGDTSVPSWDEAPLWQKASTMNSVQLFVDNPAAGPELLHDVWMQEKVAGGWVYGPAKCPVAKTHPSLIPFGELSLVEQEKDLVFATAALAVLAN